MSLFVPVFKRILYLFGFWLISAQANYAKHLDFVNYCLKQQSMPAAEQYTLKVLKKKFGEEGCDELSVKLHQSDRLWVAGLELESIRFLDFFVHFKRLDLSDNRIKDIESLANLKKLTHLWLAENEIKNIGVLSSLHSLKLLELADNQIWSIDALRSSVHLRALNITGNWIADISPLKMHRHLRFFFLGNNMIEDLSSVAYHPDALRVSKWSQLKTIDKQQVIDWKRLFLEELQPHKGFRVVELGENPLGLPSWHGGVVKDHRNCPLDSSYEVIRQLCRF
ncbi:MAG: leucine-rich repeat domain-containing protein [Oligoflexales bacterium]|nr:leucine-rich repeat domain-containing protein [Oligoflexales bacterium]